MLRVMKVPEGIQLVSEKFKFSSEVSWVQLHQGLGRRLATSIYATFDIPHYRRSTVDGYAVRAVDVAGASESSPILMPIQYEVSMGKVASEPLRPGFCVYVPTGGHVPDGADAMVMVEFTQDFGRERLIEKSSAFGDHIVRIGEDVTRGSLVLEENQKIEARHLGLLSTLGYSRIPVRAMLKAVILATGDEIAPPPALIEGALPERSLEDFGVYDANNALIISSFKDWEVEVFAQEFLEDTREAFNMALEKWHGKVDLIVLSGGSSKGVKDLTEASIAGIDGAGVLLHGLAIQPGKPTIVGCSDKTLFIGLPGHPGACYTTLRVFVEPLLLTLRSGALRSGIKENLSQGYLAIERVLGRKSAMVEVDFNLHGSSGRTLYQLVTFEHGTSESKAKAIYGKSGMLAALAHSEGYIVLPDDCEGFKAGDRAVGVFW